MIRKNYIFILIGVILAVIVLVIYTSPQKPQESKIIEDIGEIEPPTEDGPYVTTVDETLEFQYPEHWIRIDEVVNYNSDYGTLIQGFTVVNKKEATVSGKTLPQDSARVEFMLLRDDFNTPLEAILKCNNNFVCKDVVTNNVTYREGKRVFPTGTIELRKATKVFGNIYIFMAEITPGSTKKESEILIEDMFKTPNFVK